MIHTLVFGPDLPCAMRMHAWTYIEKGAELALGPILKGARNPHENVAVFHERHPLGDAFRRLQQMKLFD